MQDAQRWAASINKASISAYTDNAAKKRIERSKGKERELPALLVRDGCGLLEMEDGARLGG
jgi:hypothetical protein